MPNPFTRLQESPIGTLFSQTFAKWSEDNVPRLSAAFSFFTILSLAPLLVFCVTVAGFFLGSTEAQLKLINEAKHSIGNEAGAYVSQLITSTLHPASGIVATLFAATVTFFSASNFFIELREIFKTIWKKTDQGNLIKGMIKTRILAFLGVLAMGAVVITWIGLSAWLSWIGRYSDSTVSHLLNTFATTLFLLCLFMVSIKTYPKGMLTFRDVLPGAAVAAIGVTASKYILGIYFAYAKVSAAYGVAGALVIVLLWIFYTSQIFFFGVELTYVYSHLYGSQKDKKAEQLVEVTPQHLF